MKSSIILRAAFVAALAGTPFIVGCANESHSSVDGKVPATLSLEPSATSIVAGETVTIVARTKDTYGRDAKVKWSSTAGKLDSEEDGRVARVKFTETGTYSVKASLSVDGRETDTETVQIVVKPVG